ncbi:PAS domain-containing sensor histidine kinase [Azospirillum picis]|uniref:histidine kinase n=1 Tax=Azospirillum picis TaxID=488438 RepID=A0ABU0MQT2_9PROT|nr:PAS domain S-box protein [Azospirillum picis]MBP2302258.1 PAS domain S-box-containing protein [Azospirillum picis]MDQ0535837.1 PAS domain S-box-containing protein [Azospirillum picis]
MQVNERSISTLFRNAGEFAAVLAPDGRVLHVSEAGSGMLGYPPCILTGARFDSHIHPDDLAEAYRRLQARAAAPAGSSGSAVFRFRHADGGWRWLEATVGNHLADPDIGGLVLNVRDVSERMEISERLKSSELRYRTFAESAPVGILQTDAAGRVLYANASAAAVAGLAPDHLLGDGWLDAVHPDDRHRVETAWRQQIATEPLLIDFRFQDRSGTLGIVVDRPVLCKRVAIEDGGGAIVTITDVSEYVRTANALLLSEACTQGLLDTAADAILTIDETGLLLSFNRAAEAMFGVSAAEMLWRPLDRLIQVSVLREEGGERMAFASGQTTALIARDRAAEAERADGSRFPVELSVSAGEVEGRRLYTAIIRDVTERRRAEADLRAAKEAAEAADRAKSAFIAGVSHELRTPLNAVIGFAQLLEMRIGEPAGAGAGAERLRDYAGSIRNAGEQLLAIIDDILDMVRVEAGGLALSEGPVDLSALAAQAIERLQFQSDRAGVGVELVADSDLAPLRADERRLRQAVENLLSNAIKFSHPGGIVTMTVGKGADGCPEVVVRDRGIGMKPEDAAAALMPFAQVDQSVSRRHDGIGLGLPLALRLVEAHGGALALDSQPGQGCTATIRLPAARLMTVQEMLAAMT